MATKQPTTPAKPPAAAATMTLKQLAVELAEANELTKKQTETMLRSLVDMVTARLKAGDKVRLTGLGILQVRDRPARSGRNPGTGQVIEIKTSRKIAFSAAKELKDAIWGSVAKLGFQHALERQYPMHSTRYMLLYRFKIEVSNRTVDGILSEA